jgi:hypothetical protein
MLQEELRRISTSISIGTIRGQPSNIIIESTLKRKTPCHTYVPSHFLLNDEIAWTPRIDDSGTDSSNALCFPTFSGGI